MPLLLFFFFFFFNDTATTEIYTLSLHDALPIFRLRLAARPQPGREPAPHAQLARARVLGVPARIPAALRGRRPVARVRARLDRKSTRLNSSHGYISYAVFCLKKKNI